MLVIVQMYKEYNDIYKYKQPYHCTAAKIACACSYGCIPCTSIQESLKLLIFSRIVVNILKSEIEMAGNIRRFILNFMTYRMICRLPKIWNLKFPFFAILPTVLLITREIYIEVMDNTTLYSKFHALHDDINILFASLNFLI